MKTIIKIVAVVILCSSFLSCERDDECRKQQISSELYVNLIQASPGSPYRFGGKLYIYGTDYINPLDIDVITYTVNMKYGDDIRLNKYQFYITPSYYQNGNGLQYDIVGPGIDQYVTGSNYIVSISAQCYIHPYHHTTNLVTKNF